MKVALLIDTWFPFIGGGQINSYEISKRIVKKGVSIDIVTRNLGLYDVKLPKNLKVIQLGTKMSSESTFSKIKFLIRSFVYIFNRNYDLIHVHAFLPGITARLLMVFKRIPAVFTVHGTSLKTNLFLSKAFRSMDRRLPFMI